MAGTPEKMLEYLLETAMDPKKEHQMAGMMGKLIAVSAILADSPNRTCFL